MPQSKFARLSQRSSPSRRLNVRLQAWLLRSVSLLLIALITACSMLSQASLPDAKLNSGTLATVLRRGHLICGVNGQLPGFSFQSPDGNYSGLDADYCRAIASALFDDPSKTEFRTVSAEGQFSALTTTDTTDQIDILLRNVPWTMESDTTLPIDFAPPIFYDGQGLLGPANFTATSLESFRNQTICVLTGSATETNLREFFNHAGIPILSVPLASDSEVYVNFANGNCAIATANRSELAIHHQTLTHPERYKILDLMIAQEPLAPVVRSNESTWLDVVRWIIYGTFRAEELGISQANVMGLGAAMGPEIHRFLGEEGGYGAALSIPNDFMKRVVHHVGNYGEIYRRNIGDPFNLDRGMNNLCGQGGLLCPMSFR